MTAVILATGNHSGRALAIALTMLLVGGFSFAYLLLWLRNSRLLVGGGVLGYQDPLGRRHTWTSSEIGAVVRAEIIFSGSAASRPAIYVLGTDGRRLMAFAVLAWSPDALERLVRESGEHLQAHAAPISAAEFRRQYPHALGWVAVHPLLVGGLLAVGLIILAIAVAIIFAR